MPGMKSSCTSSTTAIGPAISSRSCRGWTSICGAGRRNPPAQLDPCLRAIHSSPTTRGRGRMPLIENTTKQKLKRGELALGFGVHHLRGAATAMLAAAAEHDWLFIDMEHGSISVHDAAQLCVAALPTGITPIVRICAGSLDEGTRCLDNGALGVIVPHVDTVERAKEIAHAFRYPPLGHRSWGGPPAAFRYQAPGNAEAQVALNDAVLVVAMIESPQAVANAEAIAAVPGIDGLLIGTSDLTAELG